MDETVCSTRITDIIFSSQPNMLKFFEILSHEKLSIIFTQIKRLS